MPGAEPRRFYFDIYNNVITLDEHGHDLPDVAAAKEEIRRTLPAMLRDAMTSRDAAQVRIDVRDADDQRVLTATIVMVIEPVER